MMSSALNDGKDPAIQICNKIFQAEGAADAKALQWDYGWSV